MTNIEKVNESSQNNVILENFLNTKNANYYLDWWATLTQDEQKRLFFQENKNELVNLIDLWWKNLDANFQSVFMEYIENEKNPLSKWYHKLDNAWKQMVFEKFNITEQTNNSELEYILYNVEDLKLSAEIKDCEPISYFKNLKTLNISSTQITNIEPLVNLKSINYLTIMKTNIVSFTPLKELINLTRLDCDGSNIIDLTPISYLHNLENLFLRNTKIISLKPLYRLEKLKYLSIVNCKNLTENSVYELKTNLPNCEISKLVSPKYF